MNQKRKEYLKKYYQSKKYKEQKRQYYIKNKDKIKKYYKKNIKKINKRKREYNQENREIVRERKLKSNYGINNIEYNKFFIKYNESCAICLEKEKTKDYRTKKVKMLVVDHNHKTGKVRGLLCHSCNLALGGFKDDYNLTLRATNYLKGKLK